MSKTWDDVLALIPSADEVGRKVNVCKEAYLFIISLQPQVRPGYFMQFIETAEPLWYARESSASAAQRTRQFLSELGLPDGNNGGENAEATPDDVLIEAMSEMDLGFYDSKYSNLICGIIDMLSYSDNTKEEYYTKLWNSIETMLPSLTSSEIGFCIWTIITDFRTPYYQMQLGLSMSSDEYSRVFDSIMPVTDEVIFAMRVRYNQNTELASRLLDLIEKLDSREQKSVLLSFIINQLKNSSRRTAEGDGQ